MNEPSSPDPGAGNFKFACPQCGQHIACEEQSAGLQINCPACGVKLKVPHGGKPPGTQAKVPAPGIDFKFVCPKCGQHIACEEGCCGLQIDCPICHAKIKVPQSGRPVAPKAQVQASAPAGYLPPARPPSTLAPAPSRQGLGAVRELRWVIVGPVVLAALLAAGLLSWAVRSARHDHAPAGQDVPTNTETASPAEPKTEPPAVTSLETEAAPQSPEPTTAVAVREPLPVMEEPTTNAPAPSLAWTNDWSQFVQAISGKESDPSFIGVTVEWTGTVMAVEDLRQPIYNRLQVATPRTVRILMPEPIRITTTQDIPGLELGTIDTLSLYPSSDTEWLPWSLLKPGDRVVFRTTLGTYGHSKGVIAVPRDPGGGVRPPLLGTRGATVVRKAPPPSLDRSVADRQRRLLLVLTLFDSHGLMEASSGRAGATNDIIQIMRQELAGRTVAEGWPAAVTNVAARYPDATVKLTIPSGPPFAAIQGILQRADASRTGYEKERRVTWHEYGWCHFGVGPDGTVQFLRGDCRRVTRPRP